MEETKIEAIKESIKVNMDLIRLLTITIIATAGGFSSLVIRENTSSIVKLLIGFSVVLLVIFVTLLALIVIRNMKLLKELRNV